MFRLVVVTVCAALALVACAGDPAQNNRNRLATAVSLYGATAAVANRYVHRPFCTPEKPLSVTNVCADRATARLVQAADRTAYTAINSVYLSYEADPAGQKVGPLVDAAQAAVAAFQTVTPK